MTDFEQFIEQVRKARIMGEAPEPLEVTDLETAIDMYWQAVTARAVYAEAVRLIGDAIGAEVGEGNSYRSGDFIYKAGRSAYRRLIDPDGFWGFLGNSAPLAVRIDQGNLRSRVIEHLAQEQGISVDSVWDTFFSTEWKDEFKALPRDKATKWEQAIPNQKKGTRRPEQPWPGGIGAP